MTKYIDSVEMVTENCCTCAMVFAMTSDYQRRRRDDHKSFYCPAGHQQHYTGPNEATKLRTELERKQQMLDAERARAITLESQRNEASRAHMRMRQRIQNGVCPCCNRTFQNLLHHMQTEHSEKPTVKTLREAFGLTQASLASEIGIHSVYVSKIERDQPIPDYAKQAINQWVETQAPKASKTVKGTTE
jgi:DNA-binding XRE family transcriptional regulator